jgi:hypothetical protein
MRESSCPEGRYDAPTDVSPVERHLEKLEKDMNNFNPLLELLNTKLKMVLREPDREKGVVAQDEERASAISPLIIRLERIHNNITDWRYKVEDILERLDT